MPTSYIHIYIYMYVCMYICEWQSVARGHWAYTDLSAARFGAGTMHSLQHCQLGNGSLLNMCPIPLSGQCVEGPSLVNHSEFQEGRAGII